MKKPIALLVRAPLLAAFAAIFAILICACPARETEGVSLWYEFVVSEIGFMLDENGELPQSLDDWKLKAEEVGGRAVTTKYVADDEGQLATEPLPANQIEFQFEHEPDIDLSFFPDLTEWYCFSYTFELHSLESREKFCLGYINRLAGAAQGKVEESSYQVADDSWGMSSWHAHFRERGTGYRATLRTSSYQPFDNSSIYVFNLEACSKRGVDSVEIHSSEFDLAPIKTVAENTPPDDAPKLLVELEPDPWRDFVAEPLSWIPPQEEGMPDTYDEWHRVLSSQRIQRELQYFRPNHKEESFTLLKDDYGILIGIGKTIRLSCLQVLFKSSSEPWICIFYGRPIWKWHERIYDPDYLQRMADKYDGSLECIESTRPYWQRKFFPLESFKSGEGRWIQQKETEANLLLRNGDYGYDIFMSLSDNSQREPGEGWILPGIEVTIFALDRIGPLTEENVKDAEMLQTLRKLAALPAND